MARRRCVVAGLVTACLLGTLALTTARPHAVAAAPGQQEGDCIQILRSVYAPPETITPPDHPTLYGRETSVAEDPRYLTTYCYANGAWGKTEDQFPYGADRICLTVLYDPDEHGGSGPPDRVTPLEGIDELGPIDSSNSAGSSTSAGADEAEVYCRDGDAWSRVPPDGGGSGSSDAASPAPASSPSPEAPDRESSDAGSGQSTSTAGSDPAPGGCRGVEPRQGTGLFGLVPDQCWGRYPSTNYDIGYDGGGFTDVPRKLTGFFGSSIFNLGRSSVQVSLWSVGWAYDFEISDYNEFALEVGDDYERLIDDDGDDDEDIPFLQIAWFALFAWVGFVALRGKLAMAGGELVVSIVLVGLSGVLMLNRADYMASTWNLMDQAETALFAIGQGRDPATAERDETVTPAVEQVQAQIHEVFVEAPYEYLNWGGPLEGRCADARDEVLASGPHGNDAFPREVMRDAGCHAEADFNETPGGQRLMGALLSMGASFVVSFVLLAVGLTVIIGKFVALLLFALAPFVGLVAVLPAGGRRLAWLWLTTLVQMIVVVIGMSFLLSLMLMGLTRLFEATADVSLVERFFVVNLAVLVMAMARRRLLSGTRAGAGRITDNLTNVRLGGGGAPWQGPMGSQGAHLLNIDRGLRYGAWGAGLTALAGGRILEQRLRERRAWRNTLKARRVGDRMAAVQHKTYYSDAPGGTHGLSPRFGYDQVQVPPGPGPAPDTGAAGGPAPGHGAPHEGTRGTHAAGGRGRAGPGRSRPEGRVVRGRRHPPRHGEGAGTAPRGVGPGPGEPTAGPRTERSMARGPGGASGLGPGEYVGYHGPVAERDTAGPAAPPVSPGGPGTSGDRRGPAPTGRPYRLIHEAIAVENFAGGVGHPFQRWLVDKPANRFIRGRAERVARKRNLRA
ncbi:MAG: hypothetical protein ACLFXM_01655 [Acidimicrobiia bacterium]